MKIALFTETYLPDINGVSTHLYTLKTGLEQLGHQVLVVTASKETKTHYMKNGILYCPSIEAKRFYGFGVASPVSLRRFRMIDEFAPDVIHVHHEFGVGLSGIRYALSRRKPILYTLHTMYDMYVHYVARGMFSGVALRFSRRYERYLASRATAVASPSRKGELYFHRIGVRNKPFYLIPNSADMSEFDPNCVTEQEKYALKDSLGIGREKTVACFVGRLGQEKSVDVLLDYWAHALKEEQDLHLLIIGSGPDKEKLKIQATQLGIQDRVTFTGRIEHADIPAYFAMCDVYITASLSEMNSISMLEGMASGLPTIQRFDEPNKEQIIEGVNGKFFQTAKEMGEHLRYVASLSPEEKADLKQQVRSSIIDRDMQGLAANLLTIYSEVAAHHLERYSATQ